MAGIFRRMASDQIRAVARQHLETSSLWGVEFVPVRVEVAEKSSSSAERDDPQPAPWHNPALSKQERLALLQAHHDANCPHCTCSTTHNRTVFGEGNPDAQIMFIGEAPGEEEDRTGRPFVGRAGQKLDDIIRAMGLARADVYIANILKCRPPNNRTPLQPEVDACSPFLTEQIRVIRPSVIVALGGPAAKMLLQTETGITRLRGCWGQYNAGDLCVPVMPTYHPAYVLRNYTVKTRQEVWSDMQAVLHRLGHGV